MKRSLLAFSMLLSVGCGGPGLPDVDLGGVCHPTELGGCVKFDGTSAFADLYGHCADPSTPDDDPLCEEPMQELGVTVEGVARMYNPDAPCVEQVLTEESEDVTERSMEQILASLRACLSQDTHEGDSTVALPTLDDELIRDVGEGDSTPDSSGGGKGSNQGLTGSSVASSIVSK